MIGLIGIATIWTILSIGGIPFDSTAFIEANKVLQIHGSKGLVTVLNKIYQLGTEGWGVTLVNVLWGAWFGRVLMETGIASTMIRKTVELGGDRPIITVFLLNIVTAIIFTAMMGAGSVIAIGVIVLPILMSLGIPKAIALFTFMASISAGMYINPVIQFVQIRAFIMRPDQMPAFTLSWYASHWGYYAVAIALAVACILTTVYLKINRTSHAWAATSSQSAPQKDAPLATLILPIVPVALNIMFNFSVIAGFLIAGFIALFACGSMKKGFKENCQLVNKLYYDGVVDTAPLIGFLLAVPMFNACAAYAAPYFKVVVGNFIPTSEYAICAILAACTLFGFFRGPLTAFGSGAATLGVITNIAHFSIPFLFCIFTIPATTVNLGCCITQSWIAWGMAYSKVNSRDYLKLSIPYAYITCPLLYALTAFTVTGLGAEWFL